MTGAFRQQVRRPAVALRDLTPPWAGSPASWDDVASFVARLPQELPAAPHPDAAVLVALYERRGEPVVVLIRRSDLLTHDPGHVAFPGGRIETGERALDAALREAGEEVGLDPSLVAGLGPLGIYGRRSRNVAAFIAVLSAPPTLVPQAAEVDAILETPLAQLVRPDVCWEERWEEVSMYFFALHSIGGGTSDLIWGLTASILWDLVSRLAHRAPEVSARPAAAGCRPGTSSGLAG